MGDKIFAKKRALRKKPKDNSFGFYLYYIK